MSQTILFLCPHGAAKSVLAAAYCQQLADQYNLDVRATSAGTEPDPTISSAVVELLKTEGIDVANQIPRHLTAEDLTAAFRVISLGCDVTSLALPELLVERWDDVPPPSQNLAAARGIILAHVERLVAELKSSVSSC